MGIGSYLSGFAKDMFTTGDTVNWTQFWLVPAAIAAVVLLMFLFLFTDKKVVLAQEDDVVAGTI